MNQEKPVEKIIGPPKLDKEIFEISTSVSQDIFEETIKLPFVNRKKEIVSIICRFAKNYYYHKNHPESWRSIYMVVSDQMHGVGKTTLAKNLLKHAPKYKKEIIENLKSSMEERYDEDFFEKTLDRIFNMKNTSNLFEFFFQEGEEKISSQIAYSIFQNSEMRDNALHGMATDEMKKYDYFLHIDEVTGNIEMIRNLWRKLITLKLELSKHNIIFDFYLTGKRTLYNKIGRGSNISPSSIEWILIHPLEKEHVQQLVNDEETFPKNISFENDELKNVFINLVHSSSGGIPRLIEFLWISFKKIGNKILKTEEEMDMIFLHSFKLIELYARDSDKFILDEELKIPALHFYALSIFCNSFKSNEIIKINEEKFEFQDIISRLPFYITKEKNELKIIQSFMYKFLKKNYEKNLGIIFSLTPNLSENIFLDPSYLFEIFILNRLISISQLNLKKKISEMNSLPFLHH
eukprot:gene4771-8352_t